MLHNGSDICTVVRPGYRSSGQPGDMAQTQQQRKAETRARLLAAAAQLFADQGVDAVSVDAVAEAAGRTSGAVYAHFGSKHGLLLALLDTWKDSVRTVLLAEVAVSETPRQQLAAVWAGVADDPDDESGRWALLEHELWLRAARDREVAEVIRDRDREARRFSAHQLAGWSTAVGSQPDAGPDDLAVLVKALLTGLAMQRRLDPDAVSDDLAVRGLCSLVGLDDGSAQDQPTAAAPHRSYRRSKNTTQGATS
jgi:AcrR family transcriptional regulator